METEAAPRQLSADDAKLDNLPPIVNPTLFQGVLDDPTHPLGYLVHVIREFVRDSVRLVRKCSKPDQKEFNSMLWACSIGSLTMGFIGYFVKLVFIPINNIIMGASRK